MRAFDRASWLADYEELKGALERSYSHLAWFGSPEGAVDLPALDRRTVEALRRATNEPEAIAAFDAFITGFHDGHLVRKPSTPTGGDQDAGPAPVEPPKVTVFADGPTACAALGYVPVTRVAFSLPFESLPGFTLVSDGLASAFRSGLLDVEGTRVGLVRIARFRAAEFPAVCLEAFTRARGGRDGGVEAGELSQRVDEVWLGQLAQRLEALRARGAQLLLVDVGGNSGGNDLGDWAVRAFTSAPVRSTQLLVVAGDAGMPYLEEQATALRQALDSDAGWTPTTREALETAQAFFARQQLATRAPCSMAWVWKERRPWRGPGCHRLVDAAAFSGPLAFLDAGVVDAAAASTLYWATIAEPVRGSWRGPVVLLTNEQTGSAAEAFVTLMRDRGIARVAGVHTLGAGCGFMSEAQPIVLSRSHLTFVAPTCVRLRDDGTDDVAGVTPDEPVPPRPGESPRARAWRLLQRVVAHGR